MGLERLKGYWGVTLPNVKSAQKNTLLAFLKFGGFIETIGGTCTTRRLVLNVGKENWIFFEHAETF